MTNSKEENIGNGIYTHIGGMGNVDKLIHCMTRVRITIKDESLVDLDALKKVPGVLGVVEDDTLQVIVGPGTVNKVANYMVEQAGVKLGEKFPQMAAETPKEPTGISEESVDGAHKSSREIVEEKAAQVKAAQKAKQKSSPTKKLLKSIANIFVPLIPAFVGAGLIGGIAAILVNLQTAGNIGAEWDQIIQVLGVINKGVFFYLAIYVGINTATEFGGTPGLGGVIGAVILLTGMNPENPIMNIFTNSPLLVGQGGIIGVIFAVWIMCQLEKWLRKFVPDSIDIIVTPTVTLLVIGLLTIFIIMPIAGVISDYLVNGITWILNVGGAFSGFVLGTAFLPMVMLGLHQVLTPIHIEMINSAGYTLLLPILAMAGAGQVGAAIALWIRCKKNKQLTNMIKGALPVGVLGIGEPLIYGVTLPLGKPFFTACLGGGVGGAIVGALGGVGAIAIGPSGVALIPLINNGHMLAYIFGLLGGYVGGFIFTYFFGVPKEAMKETELED